MKHYLVVSILLFSSLFNTAFANTSTTKPKVIYLSGENHGNQEDNKFKSVVMKGAAAGMLIFGLENLSRDSDAEKKVREFYFGPLVFEENYMFGIEDPLMNTFTSAVSFHLILAFGYAPPSESESLQESVASTKTCLFCADYFLDLMNSVLVESNQNFLEKFWSDSGHRSNPIFQFLYMNKSRLINKSIEFQNDVILLEMENWKNSEALEFTKMVSLSLLENVRARLATSKQLEDFERLARCMKRFEKYTDCDIEQEYVFNDLMDILRLTMGDYFLARNLEEIYENTKELKKPLISIVGHAHVQGVTEELRKRGFMVLGKTDFLMELRRI